MMEALACFGTFILETCLLNIIINSLLTNDVMIFVNGNSDLILGVLRYMSSASFGGF